MSEVIKYVNDLGIAAYLVMHGHDVVGKSGKSVYFRCLSEQEAKAFSALVWEYGPPNDFYIFDSCLMFLKKISEEVPDKPDPRTHTTISGLGAAAFILLHECNRPPETRMGVRVIGKRGADIFFHHPEGIGDKLKEMSWSYLRSQFQKYDTALQAIKRNGEYLPRE
jgi:hypothetical protein